MLKVLEKRLVVIVEDDKFLADLLRKKLEQEGAIILVASSGEDLLKTLGEKQPSLIVMDILLPGIDGFETLRQIRIQDRLKNTPVILLSNLELENYEGKIAGMGKVGLLIKSDYNLDELVIQIEKFLTN